MKKFSRRQFISGSMKGVLLGVLAKVVPETRASTPPSVGLNEDDKKLAHVELAGKALEDVMERVHEHPDFSIIQKYLNDTGFSENVALAGVTAYAKAQPDKTGTVIYSDYKGKEEDQFIRFVCTLASNEVNQIGIAIVHMEGTNKHVSVLEVQGEELTTTSELIIHEDGSVQQVVNGEETRIDQKGKPVLVQRQMDTGPQKKENFTIEAPPQFPANIAGVVGEPPPVFFSVL